MNDLPTDAIEECIGFYASQDTKRRNDDLAWEQLAALVDDNHKKASKIIELQREIVDIHRHYGKRLGE